MSVESGRESGKEHPVELPLGVTSLSLPPSLKQRHRLRVASSLRIRLPVRLRLEHRSLHRRERWVGGGRGGWHRTGGRMHGRDGVCVLEECECRLVPLGVPRCRKERLCTYNPPLVLILRVG